MISAVFVAATFIALMASTIVNVALPTIGRGAADRTFLDQDR
jgi:hypothetical protein